MKYEKLIELVDNPNSFGNQRPTLPIELYYILFLQSSPSISNIAFEGTSIAEIQFVVDSQVENVIDAGGRCINPNLKWLKDASQTDGERRLRMFGWLHFTRRTLLLFGCHSRQNNMSTQPMAT